MRRKLVVAALLVWINVQLSFSAWACSIPVFRYALERWPAGSYRIVIFRGDKLNPQQAEVVASLRKTGEIGYSSPLVVFEFDIKAEIPEEFQPLVQSDSGLPRMHLLLPEFFGLNEAVWSGPLTPENGQLLVQSPARNKIARRLVEGESAVWILLEGPSAGENAKALGNLRKALKNAKSKLKLPNEIDEGDTEYDLSLSEVAMKLDFSIVSVKRSDPLERILVNMIDLMVIESERNRKPIAVPVFGRGRALAVYMGDGIEETNILEACSFLVGPCSCEVKEMNPGMDLFMPIDWDGLVEGTIGVDEALPPLSVPVPAVVEKQTLAAASQQSNAQDNRLRRNLAVAALIGLIVLAVGTVVVIRRKNHGK